MTDFFEALFWPWKHPDDPPVYWAMLQMKDGREFRYQKPDNSSHTWSSPLEVMAYAGEEQWLPVGKYFRMIALIDHPDVECIHIFDARGYHCETIRRDEDE